MVPVVQLRLDGCGMAVMPRAADFALDPEVAVRVAVCVPAEAAADAVN